MVPKVLGKKGDKIKAREMMYKEVVHAVLLYGSERWVVTDATMTVLEDFHNRIARRIAGMMAQRGDGGEREWALVNVALEVTDIWPIRKYLQRRQAKRAEYVKGRTIYKLCTGPDRI